MWSFLFISNHLQASGWELVRPGTAPADLWKQDIPAARVKIASHHCGASFPPCKFINVGLVNMVQAQR